MIGRPRIYVGYNYTLLHAKTTSSSSYGSRKEDFPHNKPILDMKRTKLWALWFQRR